MLTGQYFATPPVAGTSTGATSTYALNPDEEEPAGYYHTHGDYSVFDPASGEAMPTGNPAEDDYNSDHFSEFDIEEVEGFSKEYPSFTGYLGTPSGTFLKYNSTAGEQPLSP